MWKLGGKRVISLRSKFIVNSDCLSSLLKCEYGIWIHPSTLEYDFLKITPFILIAYSPMRYSPRIDSMNHLVCEWNYLLRLCIQNLSHAVEFKDIFIPILTRIWGLWTNPFGRFARMLCQILCWSWKIPVTFIANDWMHTGGICLTVHLLLLILQFC